MLPVIYYVTFFLLLLVLLFRARCNNISKYIVAIWLTSSVFALVFYYLTEEMLYRRIDFIPFVFMHLCFILSVFPVIRVKIPQKEYSMSQVNITLYKNILCFFIILSIVPFVENLKQVLSLGSSDSELAEIYDSKMYGGGFEVNWLSPIGMIGNSLDGVFLYFLIFSPFYLLTRKDVSMPFVLLSMIPVSTHLLFQMAAAGRTTMVTFMLMSILLIFLFQKSIPINRFKKIRNFGIIAVALMFMGLTAITLSRKEATNAGDDFAVVIGYYVAKGHLDFNENLWHMKQHTEGDNSFSFLKSCMGLPTYKSFLEKEKYWNESRIGVPPGFFYTYIGDLYMDFGPIITLFLYIFVSFVSLFLIYKWNGNYSIVRCFLVFIYCSTLIMGWSINIFKTYDGTKNMLLSLLLLVFIQTLSTTQNFILNNKLNE